MEAPVRENAPALYCRLDLVSVDKEDHCPHSTGFLMYWFTVISCHNHGWFDCFSCFYCTDGVQSSCDKILWPCVRSGVSAEDICVRVFCLLSSLALLFFNSWSILVQIYFGSNLFWKILYVTPCESSKFVHWLSSWEFHWFSWNTCLLLIFKLLNHFEDQQKTK